LPHATPRWIPITATAALLTIAATMTLQWMGVAPTGRALDPGTGADNARTARVEPARSPSPATLASVETALEPAPGQPGVADSLFDHSADVEFILDPVVVRKGRAHTVLHVNPSVQGEKAVITF